MIKYIVVLQDAYEIEYEIFDTEKEALELVNSLSYKTYTATVVRGEELEVRKTDNGKKILVGEVNK